MIHLLLVQLAAPAPAATPSIDVATAAHNLTTVAEQAVGGIFAFITGVLGIKSLIRGRFLEAGVGFALATFCAIFVFAPDAVVGVALSVVKTARGQ